MKLKVDFVSNSSSASFILHIDSQANTFSKFVEDWERYIKFYIENHHWRIDSRTRDYMKRLEENKKERKDLEEKKKQGTLTDGEKLQYDIFYSDKEDKELSKEEIEKIIIGNYSISHVVGDVYEVSYFTCMYNSVVEDLPEWMTYLIIHFNIDRNEFERFGFRDIRLKIED